MIYHVVVVGFEQLLLLFSNQYQDLCLYGVAAISVRQKLVRLRDDDILE